MAVLNLDSGPTVKRIICGRTLQRLLAAGSYSPTAFALIGHCLEIGEYGVTCTAPRQSAFLTGTPMAFLRTIRRATPLELAAMKRGDYTVEALHKEQLANRRMSDAELKRMMIREGLNRVLDLIDELTRPDKANGHAAANDNDNGNGGVAMPVQLSL